MAKYPRTEGFGLEGVEVTEAGYVFVLRTPAKKFSIQNTGGENVVVIINGIIQGADSNKDIPTPESYNTQYHTMTADNARQCGTVVQGMQSQLFEGVMFGDSQIRTVCLITEGSKTTTVRGGVVSF